MKKQLVLGLGLAVIAAPAFASKARLQALGESTNGSFFISDNRNIFLNAAEVNNNKDLVTLEWGSGKTTDTDTAPNAEGGVIKSINNMVYGVHLGRTTSFGNVVNAFNNTTKNSYTASNVIDLFVGGDAGVKWGANATWSQAKDDSFDNDPAAGTTNLGKAENKSLDLNVGAQMGDLAAYVKGGVLGNSFTKDNTGTKFVDLKRKHEIEVGASYKITDYTVFAQVNNNKYDNKATGRQDIKGMSAQIGAARTEKLNDKTMAFVKLTGNWSKLEGFNVDGTPVAVNGKNETKTMAVPVAVGMEHDAASWLTLRGSIAQNLWSSQDDDATKKRTIANSTNVNAGATLKFGDLNIDGVVGTGKNAAGTAIVDSRSEAGVLSLDNLMTRVSMTYRF